MRLASAGVFAAAASLLRFVAIALSASPVASRKWPIADHSGPFTRKGSNYQLSIASGGLNISGESSFEPPCMRMTLPGAAQSPSIKARQHPAVSVLCPGYDVGGHVRRSGVRRRDHCADGGGARPVGAPYLRLALHAGLQAQDERRRKPTWHRTFSPLILRLRKSWRKGWLSFLAIWLMRFPAARVHSAAERLQLLTTVNSDRPRPNSATGSDSSES